MKEGVILESHESRVVTNCGEKAILTGDAVSDPHLERAPGSRAGVDGRRVGLSDGEVLLTEKGLAVEVREQEGWKARPCEECNNCPECIS